MMLVMILLWAIVSRRFSSMTLSRVSILVSSYLNDQMDNITQITIKLGRNFLKSFLMQVKLSS